MLALALAGMYMAQMVYWFLLVGFPSIFDLNIEARTIEETMEIDMSLISKLKLSCLEFFLCGPITKNRSFFYFSFIKQMVSHSATTQ